MYKFFIPKPNFELLTPNLFSCSYLQLKQSVSISKLKFLVVTHNYCIYHRWSRTEEEIEEVKYGAVGSLKTSIGWL